MRRESRWRPVEVEPLPPVSGPARVPAAVTATGVELDTLRAAFPGF